MRLMDMIMARSSGKGVLFLAAAVLLGIVIVKAGWSYHWSARQEIESKAGAYAMTMEKISTADELGFLDKKLNERLGAMERGLLRSKKPNTGAAELQDVFRTIISGKQISITSERALTPSVDGPYTRVPVEFQFKGGVPQLKDLLYDLQASQYHLGVKSVRIRSNEGDRPGTIHVSMIIEGVIKGEGN